MGKRHEEDIRKYYADVFGFDSSIEESSQKLIELFPNMGAKMYYDGEIPREAVDKIPCQTELDGNEVFELMKELIW